MERPEDCEKLGFRPYLGVGLFRSGSMGRFHGRAACSK